MGRGAAAGAAADARRGDHGLPRLGARRAPVAAGRDERAAARDGSDAELRPVQSRPADLCRTEARRHREAVRAQVVCYGSVSIRPCNRAGTPGETSMSSKALPILIGALVAAVSFNAQARMTKITITK